jgi:hypothetical protein
MMAREASATGLRDRPNARVHAVERGRTHDGDRRYSIG